MRKSILVVLLLFGMAFCGTCRDTRVDAFTGLRRCLLDSLETQIREECLLHPIPAEVAHIDSLLALLKARKHTLLLHYKYEAVSTVCFRHGLSVSNRVVNDTFFTCVINGGY